MALGSDNSVHATFAYGWKSPTFYLAWGLDPKTTELLTHGFLDPVAEQSELSELFLDPFLMAIQDPPFMDRIKKRYAMFKNALNSKTPKRKPHNVIPINEARRLRG